MKKNFIFFSAVFCALSLNAQISNPKWEDFEGESLTLEDISYDGTGNETYEIVDNPSRGGINNSDKCLGLTTTDQHDWWHKIYLRPAEGEYFKAASDQHVYLHFKMYRTRLGGPSEVHVYDENETEDGHLQFQINNTKVNCWEDFVLDVTEYVSAGKGFRRIMIQPELQWNGPGAVPQTMYFFDDFQLLDSSYPDGANILDIENIVNFDDEELTSKNLLEFNINDPNASYEIVDNPNPESVNLTKKVLCYNKPAATTWWYALQLPVNGVIKAEYPKNYLHVMMYTGGQSVRVIVKDHMGNQCRSEYVPYDASSWEDFVMDISELKGGTISFIEFAFGFNGEENWDNPAGKFYIDEIVLNDNFDAREEVSSIIGLNSDDDFVVLVEDNNVRIESSSLINISVYTLDGEVVYMNNFDKCDSLSLPDGFYLVKGIDSNGCEMVKKFIVK